MSTHGWNNIVEKKRVQEVPDVTTESGIYIGYIGKYIEAPPAATRPETAM